MKGGGDVHIAAASGKLNRGDFLDFIAGSDAFSAEDAFRLVEDDCRTCDVQRIFTAPRFEDAFADSVILRELLQFAASAPDTVETIVRMIRKQQFDDDFARLDHARRVGRDHHSRLHGSRAGRHEPRHSPDLHNADPAGSGRRQLFHMAERRDMDSRPGQCGEDRFTRFRFDSSVVRSNFKHGWFSRFRCPGRLHRIYMRPCSSRNRCRAGDLWHGAPGEFPVLR